MLVLGQIQSWYIIGANPEAPQASMVRNTVAMRLIGPTVSFLQRTIAIVDTIPTIDNRDMVEKSWEGKPEPI
jgi:hypothetical protein